MIVLLVDDDKDILENNREYLSRHGCDVITACNAEQALQAYEEADVISLDVALPDGDGFSLATQLRGLTMAPILFLTAKKTEQDLEASFELGSDYMCKPYSLKEFYLRIEALEKKRKTSEHYIVSLSPIHIDIQKQIVMVNEKEVLFTRHEFIILTLLVKNKNESLTYEQIFKEVWGEYGFEVYMVAQHVSAIRRKLQKYGADKYIKTLRGIGYTFAYPIEKNGEMV